MRLAMFHALNRQRVAGRSSSIPRLHLLGVGIALVMGCGGDSSPDSTDTSPDTDTVEPGDVVPDTVDTVDTDPGDLGDDTTDTSPDVPPDTATDGTDDIDTVDGTDGIGPGTIAATPGARCEPGERIGLVQIEDQGSLYVNAWVYDRTNPVYGPAEKTEGVCSFYRFVAGTAGCPDCELDKTCGRSGQCETLPLTRRDVVLELASGDSTQRFESSGDYGEVWGEVTIGKTVSLSLTFGGLEVTLGATTLPDALQGVAGTLTGDYENPESLSLSWTPVSGDSQVFTHVPMNHHVAEPTFTECATAASSGSMVIGGDMLKPLAVVTGLEFQGIEHARFAAAETPLGCVEVRFQTRAYVPLF